MAFQKRRDKKMAARELIACHGCDLLQKRPVLTQGQVARCPRCATPLLRYRPIRADKPLALTLTGLILFLVAVSNPFLTINLEGRQQQALLFSGAQVLYQQGFPVVAGLAVFTGILAPLLQLSGICMVLVCLKCRLFQGTAAWTYRWMHHLQTWAMAEVFLLGILVASVKMMQMADLHPGAGLYAFMACIFFTAAATAALDPENIWQWLPIRSKSR
jgi:paraquat-inducible protein A